MERNRRSEENGRFLLINGKKWKYTKGERWLQGTALRIRSRSDRGKQSSGRSAKTAGGASPSPTNQISIPSVGERLGAPALSKPQKERRLLLCMKDRRMKAFPSGGRCRVNTRRMRCSPRGAFSFVPQKTAAGASSEPLSSQAHFGEPLAPPPCGPSPTALPPPLPWGEAFVPRSCG